MKDSKDPTPHPAPPHPPEHEVLAGSAPTPIWLFVLLSLLMFWGIHYMDEQGGGFHASVYRPHRSLDQIQAMIPRDEGEILFASGQRLYGVYCSVCHQPGGQGAPGQFPPLAQSEWVDTPGDDRLIRIVLDGLQGPITVRGQTYNLAMPPFGDLLRDEEVAAILTYIRQNQIWGNNAPAVSPDRVTEIRQATAARNAAWTAAELLRIPENAAP
jgi:mono/diheme cytochrome c family protein